LINELERLGIIRLKDESILKLSKSAKHSQLRVTLDPMEREWNYVRVESNGRRSEVLLTEQGETALRIFGVPQTASAK